VNFVDPLGLQGVDSIPGAATGTDQAVPSGDSTLDRRRKSREGTADVRSSMSTVSEVLEGAASAASEFTASPRARGAGQTLLGAAVVVGSGAVAASGGPASFAAAGRIASGITGGMSLFASGVSALVTGDEPPLSVAEALTPPVAGLTELGNGSVSQPAARFSQQRPSVEWRTTGGKSH
jgi:hypothetical protein